MTIERFRIDPVYSHAAATGSLLAQANLAIQLITHADQAAKDSPHFANELAAAAEVYAGLAAEHDHPSELALLGTVFAFRSVILEVIDPVRAIAYREHAVATIDQATTSRDIRALRLATVAFACLADAGDDEAAEKLNSVVEALPAEEAVEVREAMQKDAAARLAATVPGD